MDLPIYDISIDEFDSGKCEVEYIALVDLPAIQTNFLAFNNRQRYAVTDEPEHIVTGPAIIADLPIYRRDKERGEYYTVFRAPNIKKIVQRFFRKGYNYNFNLMHDLNRKTDTVYIYESYLIDRAKGKHPMDAFADLPDGSWMITAKIDDAEIWNSVVSGQFRGFSVEGLFYESKFNEQSELQKAYAELEKLLQSI